MKRGLLSWGLFLLWVGLVLSISSQSSPPGAETVGAQVGGHGDDIFHFIEYAAGAFLAYIAIVYTRYVSQPRIRYMLAFALSLLIASVDEAFQGFVPGRTASVLDVGVDTLGIVSCLAAIGGASWLYQRLRGKVPLL